MTCKHQQRRIAYHEAGQAVVGQHFGLTPLTYLIRRCRTRENGRMFIIWEGETMANWNSLSPHQHRVAGVAGAIAENCWTDRDENDDIGLQWDAVADHMSDADWTINGVQADPSYPSGMSDAEWELWWAAMQEAHALLNPETGPLWRKLRVEANQLIKRAS
jgi:hypothetical protein